MTHSTAPIGLPLELGPLDHYTLIVEDAASVADFHCRFLGFEELRIQKVNAGSVPEGEYDMLNHVLAVPGATGRVMVVTEGLTDESIFRRYLREHGAGVHHVAYEVDSLDDALLKLRESGIATTSDQVLKDPLTGLRQVFISKDHGGYFIELIERTAASTSGQFTNNNMAALAKTMLSYLNASEVPEAPADPATLIEQPLDTVLAYLRDPSNLGRWTGHRNLRQIDGQWVEVRMCGDLPFSISESASEAGCDVHFEWQHGGDRLRATFTAAAVEAGTRVAVALPPLEPARRQRMASMIQAELDILKALLEGRADQITDRQRQQLDEFHLEIYQREGL